MARDSGVGVVKKLWLLSSFGAVVVSVALVGCGTGEAGQETNSVNETATESFEEVPAAPAAEDEAAGNPSEPDDTPAVDTETGEPAPVQVRETSQARLLETADGLTIYGNVADVVQGEPTCPAATDDCSKWLPLLVTESDLPSGLDPTDFVLVEVTEGYQLSYTRGVPTGLPLYTFADDAPGEYGGHDDGLGSWGVVGEEGKLMNTFDPDADVASGSDQAINEDDEDASSSDEGAVANSDEDLSDWASYWQAFSGAVQAGDGERVASLALDPVPLGTSGVSVTGAELVADFDEYFPDPSAFDIGPDELEERTMIERYVERFNTPVGEIIYFMIVDVGTHSLGYGFAQVDGPEFQLRSIQILQT